MAGHGHHRPRKRALVLAAIAFILSAVFLTYTRLGPISFGMYSSSRLALDDIDDDTMSIEKSKHDNGDTKRTYPQVSILPASLLPTNTSTPHRLLIIGDVHGHLKSLEALLKKAEFSPSRGDTVVFAGDMVNKGPDSAGVVALAMRIGAFGVRGNHEDRVQRAWEYLEAKNRETGKKGVAYDGNSHDDSEEDGEESALDEKETGVLIDAMDTEEGESDGVQNSSSGVEVSETEEEDDDSQSTSHRKKQKTKKGGKKEVKKGKKEKKKKKGHKHKPHHRDIVTAKKLKPEQRDWLSRLPLILRIGDLGRRYGEVLVVHAGLVPGIPLEEQEPEAVMTMRTILLSSSSSDAANHLPANLDPNFDPSSHTENNNNQTPLTTTTTTGETPEHQQKLSDEMEETVRKGRKHHSILIPSASRKGIPWAEIWTSYQTDFPTGFPASSSPSQRDLSPLARATVVYGHDAKAGLQMRRYAFGLDSGCGNGERLTGVLFEFGDHGYSQDEESGGEDGESQRHKAKIRHRLVSVSCAHER
ncbi:Metallo-dependent phosphatase [Xylaria telfairii]|nr:Metallo-dependent phosphatase [Xylaria telfairii]